MPVSFHLPRPVLVFSRGQNEIQVDLSETTVGDALIALYTLFPGLRDRIENEQHEIRGHINVFVSSEEIRHTGGLATPISGNEEIWIVPAISGG